MKKTCVFLTTVFIACFLISAIPLYPQEVKSSDLPGTVTAPNVVGAEPWIPFVFSGPGDVYIINFSTVDPADLEIGTQDCCILDDVVQIFLDGCLLGEHRSVDGIKYAYHTVSLPPGNHTIRLVNTASSVSGSGWLYRLTYSAFTGNHPYCATLSDLEVTKLDFGGSQYPYDPNQLSIIAHVRNKGTTIARNIQVVFSVSGQEVDSANFSILPPGGEWPAKIYYTFPERLNENMLIEARAGISGEDDLNPQDNMAYKHIGFYWASNDGGQTGFLHDRDSFNFANWGWKTQEEIDLELRTALGPIADSNLLDGLVTAVETMVSALLDMSGHCTGMATASGSYFISPETKPFSPAITTYNASRAGVFADILERHSWGVISILPELMNAWIIPLTIDEPAEYQKALSQVRDMNRPAIIELFSDDVLDLPKAERQLKTPHTVLCYKILDLQEEGKKLFIYDNNYQLLDTDSESYNDKTDDYFVNLDSSTCRPSYGAYDRLFVTPVRTGFSFLEKNTMIDVLLGAAAGYGIYHALEYGIHHVLQFLHIHSPVQTLLIDEYGRRIGTVDGQRINEIPGAGIIDELGSELFFLPGDLSFRAEMNGIATGTLGIDSVTVEDKKIKIVKFRGVGVQPGRLIKAEIDPNLNKYLVNDVSSAPVEPVMSGVLCPGIFDGPLSADALVNCVNFYYEIGWIKNAGVKDGFLRKLSTIQEYLTNHRVGATINQLLLFSNQVNNAKNVNKVAKEYLESLTKMLITRLKSIK